MEEKIKPEHPNNNRFSTRKIMMLIVFAGLLVIVLGGFIVYERANNPTSTLSTTVTDLDEPESCSLPPTPTPSSGVSIGDFMLKDKPDLAPQGSCALDP